MNIHKTIPFVQAIKEEEILHLGNWYLRKEFSDNTFVWKTMHGDGYAIKTPDELEKEYQKLINKPVETTNEQPKKDLEVLYEDQKNIKYPILYKREYGIEVQLTGMSISLQNDGTFFINDTTGG